jgi:type 1 glutamine amidotransferase
VKLRIPILTIFVALTVSPVSAQVAGDPVKVLIITGSADLPYHVWQETTASMRGILETSGHFRISVLQNPETLDGDSLRGFDVVVLNYNGPRWPRRSEEALEAFIRDGGGFFAFHHASYGTFFGHEFRENRWQQGPPGSGWEAFPVIIGASWLPENIGHARRCVFEVDWIDRTHPASSGLPKSFQANDELYHKLDLTPEVQVLATALSPADLGGTGNREPMVWVNQFGRGRVYYTVLGHDTLAWEQPGMASLLTRGVTWAASKSD